MAGLGAFVLMSALNLGTAITCLAYVIFIGPYAVPNISLGRLDLSYYAVTLPFLLIVSDILVSLLSTVK